MIYRPKKTAYIREDRTSEKLKFTGRVSRYEQHRSIAYVNIFSSGQKDRNDLRESLNQREHKIQSMKNLTWVLHNVAVSASLARAKNEQLMKEEEFAKKAGNALQMNEWYHGLMPREEIEEMLHADGDFIVRRTEVGGKTRLVVSVMNKGRIRHILLMFADGKWSLRNMRMGSITALILEHVKMKVPVQGDGTLLTHPVPRPDYYILHDHVVVKDQIGSGAFGDVHIGVLKQADGSRVDVAIKRLKGLMTKRQRSVFMKSRLASMYPASSVWTILSRETPMTAPEGTPQVISRIMTLCFTQEPANRPNFVELFKILAPNEKLPEVERTPRV
uniref:Tyrosine-protein kinase n=1 Tax=Ascaris lumbricoides TaxID=6252 RepID=A0A9J2P9B3_ASCLU